jgi:hypothetical protein
MKLRLTTPIEGEEAEFVVAFTSPFHRLYYNNNPGRLQEQRELRVAAEENAAAGEEPTGVIVGEERGHAEGGTFGVKRSSVWDYFRNVNEGRATRTVQSKGGPESRPNVIFRSVQCTVLMPGGEECGWGGTMWNGETGGMHKHVKKCKDTGHKSAADVLNSTSVNQVPDGNGGFVQKYTFAQLFDHHLRFTRMVVDTRLPANLVNKPSFVEYIQGFDKCIGLPCKNTMNKMMTCLYELVQEKQNAKISKLRVDYKGKNCLGVQWDSWQAPKLGDEPDGASFFGLAMTTVRENADGSLELVSELLHFEIFELGNHTGPNIKYVVEKVFKKKGIKHEGVDSMISLVCPDGAADGLSALKAMRGTPWRVCEAHNLNRTALYALGTAQAKASNSSNPDVRAVMRKHGTYVRLLSQAKLAAKLLREAQTDVGIAQSKALSTVKSSKTRWNGEYHKVKRNNILAPFIAKSLEKYRIQKISRPLSELPDPVGDDLDVIGSAISFEDLLFTNNNWKLSREIEACMKKAAETSVLIEGSAAANGKSTPLTPDQTDILLKQLRDSLKKETVVVPGVRKESTKDGRVLFRTPISSLLPGSKVVRKILAEQLDFRTIEVPLPPCRLVCMAMSKQKPMSEVLSLSEQDRAAAEYEFALRTVYNKELGGFTRATQSNGGTSVIASGSGGVRHVRKVKGPFDDSDEDEDDNEGSNGGVLLSLDPVASEIAAWKNIPTSTLLPHTKDGMLNQYSLMSSLKDSFPLHARVFKQNVAVLSTEANIERVFSASLAFSDPNMDAETLTLYTYLDANLKWYNVTVEEVKDKWRKKYGERSLEPKALAAHDSKVSSNNSSY